MAGFVSYRIEEGVALVTLDAPGEKVNVLSDAFLGELEATARRLAEEGGVRGVVVFSAKEAGFVAGADIGAIEQVADPRQGEELSRRGQRIFGLWADLPFPVVAAVHGHCLGGGLEFALACGFRVAAPGATFALPEVRLGIIPGFGGTQRLPRLIGLEQALDLILTGRTVGGEKALKAGLVDRLAPPEALLEEALALAREAVAGPQRLLAERRRRTGGLRSWLLEKNPLGRALLLRQARRRTLASTRGHYPAPPAALEVVRKGISGPLEAGLALEARELGRLIVTPECKNLVHVYHLSQRPKKLAGSLGEAAEVRRTAVLGAGVMGTGIAQLLAAKGLPVLVKDIRPEAVEEGLGRMRSFFAAKREKQGRQEAGEVMDRVEGVTSYDGFREVDLVVEAVAEKMAVKRQVLRETEAHLAERALFATNTSALSVSELQQAAFRPQSVGGMHFFNPVEKMPLVEVVQGEQTAGRTVATLFATALRLGKTPVLTADRPGFLVNRLLVSFLNEACLLAEEGVDWRSLDRAAAGFGLPMGPFRLIDEVGIDIAAEVGATLGAALPYLQPSEVLRKAGESGLLGKKGGAGFYRYQAGHSRGPNPQVSGRLGLKSRREAGEQELRRMLFLMVNEAGRCLEERVVAAPEDVDTGMVFGAGFPPFRGGLCRWADAEGLAGILTALERLAAAHGERFAPCAWLKGRERFYGQAHP